MIKFLELTAPDSNEFRQVKIVSIVVSEGDRVAVGDPLFKVKKGDSEYDLPATMAGKVAEVIASLDENISILTPLVLLETEVAASTATPPLTAPQAGQASSQDATAKSSPAQTQAKKRAVRKKTRQRKKRAAKKVAGEARKNHEQQSLDLSSVPLPSIDLENEEQAAGETTAQQAEQASTSRPASDIQLDDNNDINKSNVMSKISIKVPDIGTDSAKVIEILVNEGDSVAVDDPLITLESDKASMDVPSPQAGTIASIAVAIDQDVSEGSVILELSTEENADDAEVAAEPSSKEPDAEDTATPTPQASSTPKPAATAAGQSSTDIVDVPIPDIGGDSAKVIEILVEPGQQIAVEDPLVTLESDKASMDVPSTVAGTVESIEVELEQEVSEGVVVVKIATAAADSGDEASPAAPQPKAAKAAAPTADEQSHDSESPASAPATSDSPTTAKAAGKSHASPSIRRFARELGVDLSRITGSGRKGRVQKDDVKQFVKGVMQKGGVQTGTPKAGGGTGIPAVPAVDFTKFGEIEVLPLNKIKRLTAANLHRSWLNVPHVTHNDESNISDLESFRKQLNAEYASQKKDIKLSPLAFIVKAVVKAMQAFPQFNSSLEPGGENLIYKKYFHIGIAVETPDGLVVPVIRDADTKSVSEIAAEMGQLAAKARDKKLSLADMSGACFTISSLGGIGGTHFTPIVNAPEVAILGVSRGKMQPVWNGSEFKPGMILPLSLSYDHRVIDGAEAARFTRQIASVLEDVRRLTV